MSIPTGGGLPGELPTADLAQEPPALPLLEAGPGLSAAVGAVPASVHHAVLDPQAGIEGLRQVRDELCEWLVGLGVPEPHLSEILIAVGEACANVFDHSGARAAAGHPAAWLRAEVHDGQLRVLVADKGQWKPPQPPGRRGRGRLMMAGLVDNLQIRDGDDGTTVELTKNLPTHLDTPP
jgi:anti-sigma regulatory factor (Ser/Thr protein kinase)